MLKLLLSIKRTTFRANDPRSSHADAEYRAKRPAALARGHYTCSACGYVTSAANGHMEIHHKDDNHHNNTDDNLVCACETCHPYQHVGQTAQSDIAGEKLGDASLIACVPEIEADDFNLLQRALGAALTDPEEAQVARRLYKLFAGRADLVEADFGSFKPKVFAAAMSKLSASEYQDRESVIGDLRLLYAMPQLKKVGQQLLADNPSMAVKSWPNVERTVMARKVTRTNPENTEH